MRICLAFILLPLILCSCAIRPEVAPTKLEKANVLPLALNDNFQFRKAKFYYFTELPLPPTQSEPVLFEMQRMNYGAITDTDRKERFGNYLTFFWRTSERADVTVRLEYRQAAMANYVMAQERYYPEARGSYESKFAVIGDDFREFGRVTQWRALLIVNGRIVALKQSFMWR